MSSPFFEDLLFLSRPPDEEFVDGLPFVQLSENAALLNSLVSLLYSIPPVIPGSWTGVCLTLCPPEIRHGIYSILYPRRD